MKNIISILLTLICGLFLIGCGPKTLSENYNEDVLREVSQVIIDQLNNEEYNEIVDNAGETIKNDESAEVIENAYDSIKKSAGGFDSIDKMSFQEKNGYAVVVSIAKFEKRDVQFIFSFDKEIKLVEIFMK